MSTNLTQAYIFVKYVLKLVKKDFFIIIQNLKISNKNGSDVSLTKLDINLY
jgi:hypothetical protein